MADLGLPREFAGIAGGPVPASHVLARRIGGAVELHGSSVYFESPNELISPPEKNVPMMFPRVIGNSRREGCISS
jgi:hypothetical protein